MGDDARLVYCSGRARHKILPLIDGGRLPRPDAIIGDVGASLWDGHGEVLSHPVTTAIAERWGDGRSRVEAALATVPICFRRRAAPEPHVPHLHPYRCRGDGDADRRSDGFDADISDGVYFDDAAEGNQTRGDGACLDPAVGTGAGTCRRRRRHPERSVDVSYRPAGVVVGNAEPALLAALPPRLPTYRAPGHAPAAFSRACAISATCRRQPLLLENPHV